MVSNINQLLGCYNFTYRWKSYYRSICLQIAINIFTLLHVTHIITKRAFHTAKLFTLVEFVQILILLIEDVRKWLIERGFSELEVRKQILRARGFSLLIWLIIIIQFSKTLKKILAELHLLLTPDVVHKALFANVSIIGLKNDRSLKDHLVWAVLSKVEGISESRGGKKLSIL